MIINNDIFCFLINHITPKNVLNELNSLDNLFNSLFNDNKKYIFMGDYNADGSYLTNNEEK